MNQSTDVSKVRKLGRGLSALLQTPVAIEVPPARPAAAQGTPSQIVGPVLDREARESNRVSGEGGGGGGGESGGVEMVPVERIKASPFQARKVFDEAPLRGLAESIKTAGVMQPIIVRASEGGTFELVAGERRWRAAKLAGLSRVPAIVRELSDEAAAEWGLIENVQREDLNAMDRAHALRQMSERFGLSHAKIAEKVGLERATVANLVRLTELEPDVAELIAAGALSSAHGKTLLSLGAGAERVRIAREAARGEWPVRKVEAEVKRALAANSPESVTGESALSSGGGGGARPSSEGARRAVLLDLERRLSQQLGTKVTIQSGSGTKGTIVIEFYGLDHFDGLMAKLGVP